MNIQFLKQNAESLDINSLNPLEQAIVRFFLENDLEHLFSALDEVSEAEAFMLFCEIFGEKEIQGIAEFDSKNLSSLLPKFDLFLSKRNPLWMIDSKIESALKELEINECPVIFYTIDDKIAIRAVNETNQILNNLETIQFNQQSIVSWKNAQKMMGVAVLGLSLSSCSKEVTTSHVDLNNPGAGTPAQPIVNQIVYKDLIFTNHGDEFSDLPSVLNIENNSKYTILDSVATSFSSQTKISSFSLMVNEEFVCGFKRIGSNFVPHETCLRELNLIPGDQLKVVGIPFGQTVKFLVKIESN